MTRKNIIIASSVLLAGLVVGAFLVLRRPARVAMERYVPSDALAFVEIDSLADVVDGFTRTNAFRELAPVLGLSSQLQQVGFVSDIIGRSGLGPDEAVVAGRAQCALAITGIDSDAGETEEGPFLHLKPAFALLIESHTAPETAARLVRERAQIIAQRIYGESVVEHTEDYQGSQLRVFEGPGPGRELVASSAGTVILIANQANAARQCLDVIAGRSATLAEDATLKQMRLEVGREPSVFAYVTAAGIDKLIDLWPLLIAGREAEPDSVSVFQDLLDHLSDQSGAGLLYSLEFEAGGVTERYLTALRPQIADALDESLKSASAGGFESLHLIPRDVESMTIVSVENAGELPERVLKQLSPAVDIVAGVALRELVINLKKQYGLAPADSVGDAIGSELALINFGDEQPRAMLLRVSDRSRVAPLINKYVKRSALPARSEQHNGTEILVSSDDDRRAASFVGDFVVLGTRDQIVKVIETSANGDGQDRDPRLRQALSGRPADAAIVHHRMRVEDAGKLLLAISKLTRVTDGSPELLEQDSARKALERLTPSISFTEFRDYGIYTQAHSAVGNLAIIGSLFEDD